MSLRGTLTLECDQTCCHAELVLGDLDVDLSERRHRGLDLVLYADGWHQDEDGGLWCPDCAAPHDPERDEAYERAASRARLNDFADTGRKDWT